MTIFRVHRSKVSPPTAPRGVPGVPGVGGGHPRGPPVGAERRGRWTDCVGASRSLHRQGHHRELLGVISTVVLMATACRQADIDRQQRAARQQQYIAAASTFHSGEDKTAYGKKAAIAGVWGLELLAGGYLKGGRFSGDDDAVYRSVGMSVDHHIARLGGGITGPSPLFGLDTATLLAVASAFMQDPAPGDFTPTFTSGAAHMD